MSLASIMASDQMETMRSRRVSESTVAYREAVVCRYRLGDLSAEDICRLFGIHRSTLYRWDREFAARMN